MSTEDLSELIKAQPFFEGLPEKFIPTLAKMASRQRFDEGDYLLRQNQDADQFFLILEGLVLLKIHVTVHGAIPVETVGPGDALGWSWLLPPYRWHFDARAKAPTEVIGFDAAATREAIEADHAFGYEMYKRCMGVVVHRLQAARMQMMDVYAAPPRGGL